MPIHDWTRVKNTGLFHHFHQTWTIKLCEALNAGTLPDGYYALAEQKAIKREPDVLALRSPSRRGQPRHAPGGVSTTEAPPRARFIRQADDDALSYARRANRIAIRFEEGELVAVVEIVSPGNKASETALRSFVRKAARFLERGVNLLIVDLFPPTPRDRSGLHKAIWDEVVDEPFDLPADAPLTLASYDSGPPRTAYIEPAAVGDALPEMPLFLAPGRYVPAPLEATYMASWATCPAPLKDRVESPRSE